MYNFRYIFLVLFSACSFAQSNTQLVVDYKLFYEQSKETTEALKKFVPNLTNESGNVLFQLVIQDTCAYFSKEKGLSSNNLSVTMAATGARYENPIYTSILQKKAYYNNSASFIFFEPNDFLIYKDCVSDWTLSSETKTIDGMVCFKATTTDYYYLLDKKKQYDVVAWYCPKLPYRFGPTFYNGLPGLIIEINYMKSTLVAVKIEKINKGEAIKKPKGKQLVSVEKYIELKTKRYQEAKAELDKP
jgi:GLPGLI family protein